MSEQPQLDISSRWTIGVAALATLAIAGSIAAAYVAPPPFFKAWLAAALLPWSVSIGSLSFLLIYELTGGRWGRAAWPYLAMNARLMPLVALLFVPWLCGIKAIYPWANSDVLLQFENTTNRQWLFQIPFFIGRTVFYFAFWIGLSCLVTGWPWSRPVYWGEEKTQPPRILGGQTVAGLGLIAILLTVTWAGIDWIMSLDPFFTSTLFGGLIGVGAMLAALSATVFAMCFEKSRHASAVDDKAFSDLANLLLAFLMLWAYFSFAHFLIMWSGDLPIEAIFYTARLHGIWGWISPLLSVGGFVVPFLCLLSHDFKRSPRKMGILALVLLAVRLVELWWMVLPTSARSFWAGFHWSILPSMVTVVAIYMAAIQFMLRRAKLFHNPEQAS